MNYRALVFDLDDTLLDTTRLLLPIWNTPEFNRRLQSTLPLMDGARENLEYLSERYSVYLLTFGNIEIQKMKIESMKIERYFKKIFMADASANQTKGFYFKKIFENHGSTEGCYLSIGNRRSTDIREAKHNGGTTCLLKYGEHKNEPIVVPQDVPDFEINHHSELIKTCRL